MNSKLLGRKVFSNGSAWVVAVVISLFLPFVLPSFRLSELTMVMVWAITILGLNIILGYTGQLALAHGLFFALGAYSVAILTSDYGWHYIPAIPVGGVLAFAVGRLVGGPVLRLTGLYLAIVTLSLSVAAPSVIKRFDGLTGGASGKLVSRPGVPGGLRLDPSQWRYYVALTVTVITFVLVGNLLRGRPGRALLAIRDHELAAQSIGVNLARFKTWALAWSALLAAVAGGLFVLNIGIVAPDEFGMPFLMSVLTGLVIGGVGTLSGGLVGGAFIVFVPPLIGEVSDALVGVLYGGILILVLFTFPSGVIGLLAKLRRRAGFFRKSQADPRVHADKDQPLDGRKISNSSITTEGERR
jgi:branched-chain amino acid transport system permease protein